MYLIWYQTQKDGVRLDHTEIPDLIQYIPYRLDLDICQPVDLHNVTNVDTEEDKDTDPYIVVVHKRFNPHKSQYEYLVKGLGDDMKENTWELPSSIPIKQLQQYEQKYYTKITKVSLENVA